MPIESNFCFQPVRSAGLIPFARRAPIKPSIFPSCSLFLLLPNQFAHTNNHTSAALRRLLTNPAMSSGIGRYTKTSRSYYFPDLVATVNLDYLSKLRSSKFAANRQLSASRRSYRPSYSQLCPRDIFPKQAARRDYTCIQAGSFDCLLIGHVSRLARLWAFPPSVPAGYHRAERKQQSSFRPGS